MSYVAGSYRLATSLLNSIYRPGNMNQMIDTSVKLIIEIIMNKDAVKWRRVRFSNNKFKYCIPWTTSSVIIMKRPYGSVDVYILKIRRRLRQIAKYELRESADNENDVVLLKELYETANHKNCERQISNIIKQIM